MKTYKNHQLSLTSLVCFVGTLQAIAVTFVMEHKASVWQIGWDMNLLAAAYAVINLSPLFYADMKLKVTFLIIYVVFFLFLIFLMFSGNCDIKHIILCSRTGYKDEGSSICHCFQPSDDDHSCNHGLFHTG